MLYRMFLKFCTLFFLLVTLTVSTVHAQEQKSYSISESGNGSFYAHIRPFSSVLAVLLISHFLSLIVSGRKESVKRIAHGRL